MLSVKRSTAAIKSSQILPRATNFAQYNTLRSSKLNTLNRKILGQEYIGAYVVSKNNNVVNSMGTGYANASEKQPFNYNSTVRVGNLESEINAILLMKTLKDSKISLSTRLNKYVPELDDKISINANQLLKMNLNISVDSKKLIGLNEKNATEKYFNMLKINNTVSKLQQQKANQILLAIVLKRLNHSSYKAVLNSFLQKNELDGSRIIDSYSFSERTDVLSYHMSKSKNRTLQYDKPYKNVDDTYIWGIDQLRMSMIDMVNLVRLFNSENFSDSQITTLNNYGKMLNIWKKSKNNIYYSLSSHGFRTYIMAESNIKRIVISSENYPNTGTSKLRLTKSIYSSLFDD